MSENIITTGMVRYPIESILQLQIIERYTIRGLYIILKNLVLKMKSISVFFRQKVNFNNLTHNILIFHTKKSPMNRSHLEPFSILATLKHITTSDQRKHSILKFNATKTLFVFARLPKVRENNTLG